MLTTLEYNNDMSSQCQQWEETPTLFVTRYEYANIYHTLGDWYNSYQALHMAGNNSNISLRVSFADKVIDRWMMDDRWW